MILFPLCEPKDVEIKHCVTDRPERPAVKHAGGIEDSHENRGEGVATVVEELAERSG